MTIKEFEDFVLYSNKNVEKVIQTIVNESDNAALVSVFEDAVILLDHNTGSFYSADYDFNGETLQLRMENFEEIDLETENTTFAETARNFFEDEDMEVAELAESYRENITEQDSFINSLISESLATKDFDGIIDYTEIVESEVKNELEGMPFFESYKERLNTHPLTSVKHFNWKSDVAVSLLETEDLKVVNSNAGVKATSLWKDSEFKTAFHESIVSDDEDSVKDLLESYPGILLLDKGDRTALFGKAIISNNELRESKKEIMEYMNELFESDEMIKVTETYITESGEESLTAADGDVKKDAPKEISTTENTSLVKKLKDVAEKVADEKLKEKLETIIDTLSKNLTEGTQIEAVKEAVSILVL